MSDEDERCGWETPEHEGVQCKVRGPHASHLLIFKVDGEQVRLLIPNESHVDAQPPVGTRPTPSSRAALREQRERIRQDATDRVAANGQRVPTQAEAHAAAQEGMQRSWGALSEPTKENLIVAIERMARENPEYQADKLREYVLLPDEPRGIGWVFQHAARRGWAEKTPEHRGSVYGNQRPQPVWRSLIYEGRRTA